MSVKMYPYIVCFCGRSLGDLYDAFKHLRHKKYLEKLGGITPDMVSVTEIEDVNLKDELDSLGILMPCCRSRMISQVEFKTVY